MSARFIDDARRIFGQYGHAMQTTDGKNPVFKVGYRSWFGFHTRGTGPTEQAALDAAAKGRERDDPSPGNDSWIPESYSNPFGKAK
jgi:hypothetical protein